MENISDDWQRALSRRIGQAVLARRTDLGMTAQALADKCAGLGVPIHRVTVTKIEAGRSGFDLGDLIVLAAALGLPPVALIYPTLPDGPVEYLPGQEMSATEAMQTFTGERGDRDGLTGLARERAAAEIALPQLLGLVAKLGQGDDAVVAAAQREQARIAELNARLARIPGAVVGTEEGAEDA